MIASKSGSFRAWSNVGAVITLDWSGDIGTRRDWTKER